METVPTMYFRILEGVCEMKFFDWINRFRVNGKKPAQNGQNHVGDYLNLLITFKVLVQFVCNFACRDLLGC